MNKRIIVLTLATCILYACGNPSSEKVQITHYAASVMTLLEEQSGNDSDDIELDIKPFPKRSSLRIQIASIEMNMRDFYAINACPLAALVAHRNTALGKAQLPSQRYVYEAQLLNTFDLCAQQISEENAPLAKQLEQWKVLKQQQFPLVWVALVQQSQEVYSALTRANHSITQEDMLSYEQSLIDLQFISRLIQPSSVTDTLSSEIELALQRIAKTRLPATLWKTQTNLSFKLANINTALENSVNESVCLSQKQNDETLAALHTYYEQVYVAQLRPYFAKIQALNSELDALLNLWQQQPLNADFAMAIHSRSTQINSQFQRQIQKHDLLWKAMLESCSVAKQND